VGTLANQLDMIEQDFILVLDDIHTIQEKSVHLFLKDLLRHPPQPMHLVLIGRRDPSLSIAALRARSQLAEVRLQDLRFTAGETGSYLQQILKRQITDEIATAWSEKTEGWVTGLRLAALTLQHQGDFKTIPPELQGGTQYVMEYLFNEVLSHQPPDLRDFLLKTSILDRFCAPLYDAMIGTGVEPGNAQNGAWQLIALLKKANLFLIRLDVEDQWFRYHHLFRDLLKRQLKRNYSAGDINTLHSTASEWFESQGLITESIEHALAAEDYVHAAEIVEKYRHNMHEAGRWHVIERWLDRLPEGIIQKRAALLLAKAWIAYVRFQLERIPSMIEQAESLLDDKTAEPLLWGELNFFRGNLLYWQGEAETGARLLEEALAQIPEKKIHVKSNTELILGLARQMIGQKERAIQALDDRIRALDPSENFSFAYLTAGLTFIHLLSGELHQAKVQAKQMQAVTNKAGNLNTDAWSSYLLAVAHLQASELERAYHQFALAAQQRYTLDTRAVIDAMAGQALAQQLLKKPDAADESIDSLIDLVRELNVPQYLSVAYSCRARLSLLRCDLATAIEWTHSINETPVPSALFMWLEIPSITQARVLIADGTEASLVKAIELLDTLAQLAQTYRFTNQTIEIAVLQSMALVKLERGNEALAALKEVVALAGPLGWIRPFIEAGAPMADLLKQLRKRDASVDYINRILAAFPDTESKPPLTDLRATNDEREFEAETVTPIENPKSKIQNSLIEPLTNRELDVLDLLAQRLQNKEIAEKLFVSPATVKSHLESIYQKLNVSNRREAIDKAYALKIITRR
jgi:LuxR family maltose regulon positive regulatory protein